MTSTNLVDLFRALPLPPAGALSAQAVPGSTMYRVARNESGAAQFLISVNEEALDAAGHQLRHIAYFPRQDAVIEEAGHPRREGRFTVIACKEEDEELEPYFFRLIAMLVDELGPEPNTGSIRATIEGILELFRALERPGTSSIQGLWAELFLISRSPDVTVAVAAWHALPAEKFDFVAGDQRLEVKSTLDELRVHEVALEQIRPVTSGDTLLVSFQLRRDREGASVSDLVEAIRERAPGADAMKRVETVVARSLGEGWMESATTSFSVEDALASMRVYDALSVPSVNPDFPAEVSHVRFSVDLSTIAGMDASEARSRGRLFEAMLPI